ncbi:MAG: hypothetical protein KKG21_06135, partial [Candidatus Omnitrophica bacterium]|nr:hypothetical protein [Candidatus Omnitrophota bacterium]
MIKKNQWFSVFLSVAISVGVIACIVRAGTLEFDGVPVDITTTANEDLIICPGAGGNTQVGDATGTNSQATSNDDLHVTGVIEVDGVTCTESGIISGSNIVSDTDSNDSLGSSTVAWSNLYVDNVRTTSGTDLSLSPASGSGVDGSVTRSAATGSEAAYDLSAAVNKLTSGNFTGLKLNVTNTASPGLLKLQDLQVNGTSILQVYEDADSANYGRLSVGSGYWDGSTSGYFAGSSDGAQIAINAASGFEGNLIDAQAAGNSVFKVDYQGNVTQAGDTTQTGNQTIAGNIVPSADSTYNLGSSTSAWRYLYVDTIATAAGQNLIINTDGGTIDIDDGTIDLSTQTVDITLNSAIDALNFDSNTLSIDASNNRVGIGTTSPAQKLHVEGQCVTGDTFLPIISAKEILNPKSEILNKSQIQNSNNTSCLEFKPITDVQPGDYVLSLNEDTQEIEPHRINALLDMGVKPVFKLTTEDGRSIRTTGNHPYLTKEGWKKVIEISVGEEIAASKLMTSSMVLDVKGYPYSNTERQSSNEHCHGHFDSPPFLGCNRRAEINNVKHVTQRTIFTNAEKGLKNSLAIPSINIALPRSAINFATKLWYFSPIRSIA